jgi:hypothetical protein
MIPFNAESSLDILLHNLFDYAGMFPPAQRSFSEALSESASLAKSLKRPWLVASDLVLDIDHLRKLTPEVLSAAGFTRPVSVCALATESVEDTTAALQQTTHIRIASIEVKVTPETLPKLLKHYTPLATSLGALLAVEPDLSTEAWRDSLDAIVALIRDHRTTVALKCRCSGPTRIGPERLAATIVAAADAQLAYKVTGGLHHPIVEAQVHPFPMGFLNVVAAVSIRRALGESAPESLLSKLLCNHSIQPFSSPEALSFEGLSLSYQEVRETRAVAHFSIGSCSLHEPDQDLSRLLR